MLYCALALIHKKEVQQSQKFVENIDGTSALKSNAAPKGRTTLE
jgi:hypothetical protein